MNKAFVLIALLLFAGCAQSYRGNCVSKAFSAATAWRVNTMDAVVISDQIVEDHRHWQARTADGRYLCWDGFVFECAAHGKEFDAHSLDSAAKIFLKSEYIK